MTAGHGPLGKILFFYYKMSFCKTDIYVIFTSSLYDLAKNIFIRRRVVANIIKPATAHSRVRYVHLPGVSSAAKLGRADIFISHAWGGIWGDLVAAALDSLGTDAVADAYSGSERRIVRVFIDVFAVRQWPGNVNDIMFEGVVKEVRTVLVVVSARELENVGNLNFKEITEKNLSILSDKERRAIPFLRIW